MVHTFDYSTQEAEAVGEIWSTNGLPGQSELYSETVSKQKQNPKQQNKTQKTFEGNAF